MMLTPAKEKRIVKLLSETRLSIRDIAVQVGVSRDAVAARKAGYRAHPPRCPICGAERCGRVFNT